MSTSQAAEIGNVWPATQPLSGHLREVPIPIQGSAWPLLRAAFPLTEDAWTQMIMVLNAMKPGLVEPKKESRWRSSLTSFVSR